MHILTTLSEPLLYVIAFCIIFTETGFVPFFFLPGDTLLFSLGIFAQQGLITLHLAVLVTMIAAFLGNILGYYLGLFIRDKRNTSSFLKKIPEKYIIKTELFYKKYGSWTVVLSRFVPVVRTIAPFLAGVSQMNYWAYILFSALGAVLWTSGITLLGFLFGEHFSVVKGEYIAFGLMLGVSILFPLAVFISKKYMKKR